MAIRVIIGVQILSATLAMLFSRLDYSTFPDDILNRSELVVTAGCLAAYVWPVIVAVIAIRKKESTISIVMSVIASVLLSLTTLLCILPAVS